MNNVAKGNVLQTFDSWGPEFEIQFDITVDDLSFAYWANVFRFTTRNSNTGCDITTYLDAGTGSLPNDRPSSRCCTEEFPCDVDEGDCDSPDDCMDGLYCGYNNCPSGFPIDHDCCQLEDRFTTWNNNTGCDVTTYLESGSPLPNGRSTGECCTSDYPCNVGEGDCDDDNDCIGDDLFCDKIHRVSCPSGFLSDNPNHDCCYRNSTGCDLISYLDWEDSGASGNLWNGHKTGSCCQISDPCNVDEGDCDSDADCMDGLYCGVDNCPFGFPSDHDCCARNTGAKTLFDFGVAVDGSTGSIRISTEDSYYVTSVSTGQSYKIVVKQYFVPGPGSNCKDLCTTGTQWTPDPVFCSGDFYYEVTMDGTQMVYEKNTSPNIFSNVMLYGSGPQYNAFNSNLGEVYIRWVKSTNTEDYCQYTESGCDLVTYEEAGCSGEEHAFKKNLNKFVELTLPQ